MTTDASTPMPHSREAEEAVLGSVLINPEMFHPIRMNLLGGAPEFYIHRHQWIWEACCDLVSNNAPIDLLTIGEELDRKGRLAEVGGPAYLTMLVNQVPSSLNAEAYADIVHSHFMRRQLIYGANEAASLAYDETLSTEEVTAKGIKAVTDRVSIAAQGAIQSMSNVAGETYDLIDQNAKSKILPGIQSGLLDLDDMLGGGWQKSDLILLSARPGGGKTSLLVQVAKHAARYAVNQTLFRNHVLFFSGEMPAKQLTMRMVASMTGVDFQKLRSGRVDEADWPRVTQAIEELSDMTMHIDDTPLPLLSQIESRCDVMASQGKLDMVCVDYLQLVQSGMRFTKNVEELDYVTTRLKGIARKYNVPVLVAHQMNRSIEHRSDDSKPQLSDLNEGGEKAPDVVLFIWKHVNPNSKDEETTLVFGKHRNGPLGDVDVYFKKATTSFESVAVFSPNR